MIREKNRLSYTHQLFNIDLTQVTTPDRVSGLTSSRAPCSPSHARMTDQNRSLFPFPPSFSQQRSEPLHELEVEFADARPLLQEAIKARGSGPTQEWTKFDDQVMVFLNNVRLLIRCVLVPCGP